LLEFAIVPKIKQTRATKEIYHELSIIIRGGWISGFLGKWISGYFKIENGYSNEYSDLYERTKLFVHKNPMCIDETIMIIQQSELLTYSNYIWLNFHRLNSCGAHSIKGFAMKKFSVLILLLMFSVMIECQLSLIKISEIKTRAKAVYCSSVNEVITLNHCFVRAYSRTYASLNLDFLYPKPLVKPIMVSMSV
jgi:hypothetical protein